MDEAGIVWIRVDSDIVMETTAVLNWTANATQHPLMVGDGQINLSRYWALLLLILSVAGIMGNLMVILAVAKVTRLKSNTNRQLSSLATADLLVCVLVMPQGLLQLVTGSWPLGDVACSMYIFLDVSLCTSSILHMCCVSLDRYIGIAYPLKFPHFRTKKATCYKLTCVWVLSILIGCPIFIHAATDHTSIYMGPLCGVNNMVFQIYGSLCAFYIPLTVMSTSYLLTVRILNRQIDGGDNILRRVQSSSLSSNNNNKSNYEPSMPRTLSLPNGDDTNAASGTMYSMASTGSQRASLGSMEMTLSLWDLQMAGSVKSFSDISRADSLQYKEAAKRKRYVGQKLSRNHYPPVTRHLTQDSNMTIPEHEILIQPAQNRRSLEYNYQLNRGKTKLRKMFKAKSLSQMVCEWKHQLSINKRVNREKKATQVLGVVFLAFVISWAPFFIINLVTAACPDCVSSPALFDFVLWLGYSASIANPIIYTIVNKHFQTAFRDMLACRLWRNEPPSIKFCFDNFNKQVVTVATKVTRADIGRTPSVSRCDSSSDFET